ncbi:hypothetical protein HN51_042604 [Arachis hypogaea]|uniref:2Fe-2S ferredoxin-type domain-containing protein n=1 Tax=Arachis hypogaea TaxID=3818 RepID=A0A444Y8X0_ARAHY|nr:photosynthetic NDH subunit of subcomplex B 3, chloroplastic [Arachis ipaensis]XP_025669442.1 photosynthetic NDH subunit of subcomplex B 3, chloroplastic [Arachis hypogaea]QHN94721.1 Photosynthetic NDH subunit of subcomplex B 3 [Arachis hypogaea]RYQ98412.1 hypothetical protein Ahy_B08g094452 [Arachis hypogaea]
MSLLQLNSSHGLCSLSPYSHNNLRRSFIIPIHSSNKNHTFATRRVVVRAISTVPDTNTDTDKNTTQPSQAPPSVGFAFIHPVLLPDGTPDIHYRTACGGQKLRDIMLDSNLDLYGPYGRPLLNCAGGGSCATCMVEVLEDGGLLNPRTDKEKEHLKRKPKNWRLACQITVGKPDSTGALVIQQLPEWKGHEFKYQNREDDSEDS